MTFKQFSLRIGGKEPWPLSRML